MVKTLEEEGIPSSIKWPNDIIIQDKKCTGILLEAIHEEGVKAVIIGIGVNLNDESFPSDLTFKAISLHQVTSKVYDSRVVLTNFMKNFDLFYQQFLDRDDSFMEVVKSHSYLDGKRVYLNYYGEDQHGTVLSIAEDGTLKVRLNDQEVFLNSGEVTLEKNYN
jgi:BirA family biotin operon repressor/biotin-[acetyl-CoA-carboxylase] ligase